MPQTYADLTISEVLSDPMINAVMRADHVTRHDLEILLKSAARKNFDSPVSRDWGRSITAPKRDDMMTLASRIHAGGCECAAW